ncbi:unnamed protein product, partial [Mesorhabditis spiculigera]
MSAERKSEPNGRRQTTESWGAWLSCTGHKLAEICGGSNTEFDLARFTLIESQKALVAARRDKGQSTNCDVETVAAMYKIIFMKAPEGTKDIFGP